MPQPHDPARHDEAIRRIEQRLRALLDQAGAGRLTRRALLDRLAAAGLGAPLATALLGEPGGAQAATPATAASGYAPTRRGGGGKLRLLFWAGPTTLNQHLANGLKDVDAARLFYEPLARHDQAGELVPVLAAHIPTRANGGVAADGRSTVWTLRPDVRWHDGRPCTADDVVFTWQYATDPATAAFTAGAYAGVRRMERLDPLRVRVSFDQPTPLPHRGANMHILPRHVFGPYVGTRSREAPANLRPVGTGPYRCTDFRPGDLVQGVANPDYHLPARPHFDSVEIKGGGDATTAARAVLQTGDYDYAWSLTVDDDVLRRIEAGGKGRVVHTAGGDTAFILLNAADPWTELEGEYAHPRSRHPLLGDPAVRRALRLLIDRRALQAHVYGRSAEATANYLNHPPQFDSTRPSLDASPAQANTLLDAAGWLRGSDGVRTRAGKRLALVFQTSTNPVLQKVQSVVKQACAQAGIVLELKAISASVFFSGDPGNKDTAGKFLADLQMYTFTRTPDPERYMQLFASWEACSKANKWLGLNSSRWSNAEYDATLRASAAELDPVRRAALFIRMNDLVCEDGHVIPLAVRANVTAVAAGLVAPTSGWDTPLAAIHDWYRQPN